MCYYSRNQIFNGLYQTSKLGHLAGASTRDMSLKETCFSARDYTVVGKKLARNGFRMARRLYLSFLIRLYYLYFSKYYRRSAVYKK